MSPIIDSIGERLIDGPCATYRCRDCGEPIPQQHPSLCRPCLHLFALEDGPYDYEPDDDEEGDDE